MAFHDVKAAYVQLDSSGEKLTEHIDILCALLTFHTVAKLNVMYKTDKLSKTPSTVKGDIVKELTQMIMRKRDILHQDRIQSSNVTKKP